MGTPRDGDTYPCRKDGSLSHSKHHAPDTQAGDLDSVFVDERNSEDEQPGKQVESPSNPPSSSCPKIISFS